MCVEAELALMGQMFTGAEDEVNRAHLAIGGQQPGSSTLRETDVLTGDTELLNHDSHAVQCHC